MSNLNISKQDIKKCITYFSEKIGLFISYELKVYFLNPGSAEPR